MSDLYDTDIVAWADEQAALLRRAAKGERVNDRIDWNNVAEEIEDVANGQRNAIEALLTNIMRHRLQIMAWPQAEPVAHWQHEIDGWRVQIRRWLRRAPKLRAEIEATLQGLYDDALESAYPVLDGVPRPPLPPECPWSLDELLAPR